VSTLRERIAEPPGEVVAGDLEPGAEIEPVRVGAVPTDAGVEVELVAPQSTTLGDEPVEQASRMPSASGVGQRGEIVDVEVSAPAEAVTQTEAGDRDRRRCRLLERGDEAVPLLPHGLVDGTHERSLVDKVGAQDAHRGERQACLPHRELSDHGPPWRSVRRSCQPARVLVLHETHRLVGAHEDELEAAFRDRWLPELAAGDDARLLWFLRRAFGTGRGYEAVTITALRDGAAYERLARRVQDGDLRSWAADVDRVRHQVAGKLLLPVAWSPLHDVELGTVPVDGEHPATLYMEDAAWPYEGKLDAYLDAARTHYAPSLEEESARSLLELRAVFQAALGAHRRREVILWQRVTHPERLPRLLTTELPTEVKAPGTWMHEGLAFRDDWESRLLRTAVWSPMD